jgi:Bacteriophage tail sheath protein
LGARTPEWKYVNVMRYFVYLEHLIGRGPQGAVCKSNGEALWANLRRA